MPSRTVGFENTFFGIYLQKSAGCLIAGNHFTGGGKDETGSGNAIHLWNSSRTRIADNQIVRHRDGIYLEFARGVEVSGNVSEANYRYGLHFMFSDSCAYRENRFRRNGAGIAVMYSKHVDMANNAFEETWGAGAYGLLLKDISDGRLEGNHFTGNSTAVFLEGSSRLHILGNTFDRNGWAIRLMANAEGNRFEDNSFSGNSFDVATNSRMNASVFDSNYWDHYQGYDLNRDGYGDVPHAPVRLFSLVVQQNEPRTDPDAQLHGRPARRGRTVDAGADPGDACRSSSPPGQSSVNAPLVVSGLRKQFGSLRVLEGVDLTLDAGQVTAVVGPNAAGKSTLIKCVLGLVRPAVG